MRVVLTWIDVGVDQVLSSTIPVVVVNVYSGSVDRELLKVGTSVSVQLRVQVGEDTSLQ